MIEINGIYKKFNDAEILKNVSLSINDGEIHGIIGQSGAGKSTLLRCINGLEACESGTISVQGKTVKSLNEHELRLLRKDFGMIFQNFNLLSRKNIFDNVALPLELWGYDKKHVKAKVSELLHLVGLEDKASFRPASLSGGQKQRVAIARALALEPKVLLCDEATSALDPKTTQEILNLLRKINESFNITMVIVTHQMEVVKSICNRASLMENGEIKATGDVQDLFLKPNEHVEKLLGKSHELLPSAGENLLIYFPKDIANKSIVSSMARELGSDVSIVGGRLEKFRDDVLGTLTINVDKKDRLAVIDYLEKNNVVWRAI